MLLNVFLWDRSLKVKVHIDELIARMSAYNINENSYPEMIKCFAIMARTELARKIKIYGGSGCGKNKGCEICTEPGHCLEYGIPNMDIPIEKIPLSIRQAVKDTKNKIITFEGKPIKPYFHYRCGGATENSENVIGNKITYLRKVFCKYCSEIEDINKDKSFTLEELENLLNIKISKPEYEYYNINGIFEKVEVDEEGRIKSMNVGGKEFKGTEIMNILNLNSTRFNYMPIRFLISCIGKGHGLGLCLIGSEKMAELGMEYADLLNYYYTGVEIDEMQLPEEGKPLKGHTIVLDAASGTGDINEAKSEMGLRESEINLLIITELRELLSDSGAEVFFTREDDKHIVLSKRAEITNSKKPDLFISISQNTFQNKTASGTEIYHYREDNEGRKLSNFLMEEISQMLESNKRGIREVEFYLLREIRCSAVLIELLYITNPTDAEKLADPDMQKKAAKAIHEAIRKYYINNNVKLR